MNRITVYFSECEPEPTKGYKILYGIAGTSPDDYLDAGYFFKSPAVFYDDNPVGTCYEGIIGTDCGDVFGNPIPWASNCESGESGGESGAEETPVCFNYLIYAPPFRSGDVHWINCDGTPGTYFMNGVTTNPNRITLEICAREGSVALDNSHFKITQEGPCLG